ncbi:type II toxin-antitoxin system antitoxin SocA domain-containing protein [Bacillus wiedmannii]|uniref:Panacea domain-containing protein n=1 Tax=Bacillus wiedmannii TaxID=1890302 RepID=UPI002FFDF501
MTAVAQRIKNIDVFEVANYFLSKSTPNTEYSITHLKLQKLVYYAQGWHLALNDGQELFEEDIRAWVHGPVCPKLYEMYNNHKYFEIQPVVVPESILANAKVKKTLDIVWETYGSYDGKFLEELTHQEMPWLKARENLDPDQSGNELISKEAMEEYFKEMLAS